MTSNQLMTYGAIGFALFAASVVLKKPAGQAVANQPGQQERDAALLTFNQQQLSQWEHMDQQTAAETFTNTQPLFSALP